MVNATIGQTSKLVTIYEVQFFLWIPNLVLTPWRMEMMRMVHNIALSPKTLLRVDSK